MMLPDRLFRSVTGERTTSAGVASDMSMMGGTPETFDIGVRANTTLSSSLPATAPTLDHPPSGGEIQQHTLSPIGSLDPVGIVATGALTASAVPTSGVVPIGHADVSAAIGAAPATGSGSVSPQVLETISTSAAALAQAIGELAAVARLETAPGAASLEHLQNQLQSLGDHVQPSTLPAPLIVVPGAVSLGTAESVVAAGLTPVDAAVGIAAASVDTVAQELPAIATAITDVAHDTLTGTSAVIAPVADAANDAVDAVVDTVDVVAPLVTPVVEAVTAPVAPVVAASDIAASLPHAVAPFTDATSPVTTAASDTIATVAGVAAAPAAGLVSDIGTAVSEPAGVIAAVANALTSQPGAADDDVLRGNDPPAGLTTLHELLSNDHAYELVGEHGGDVVFSSVGSAGDVVADLAESAAPLDTLVTSSADSLLGVADDDHHGVLGGLGLGHDHG